MFRIQLWRVMKWPRAWKPPKMRNGSSVNVAVEKANSVISKQMSCSLDPTTNSETTNLNFHVSEAIWFVKRFVKVQDSQFRNWLLDLVSEIKLISSLPQQWGRILYEVVNVRICIVLVISWDCFWTSSL